MNISNYIFGPQLVGVIICLAGLIMQRFPPKKVNNWYGYRTASSMKNQQTWDEANRYSAGVMVTIGMILFVTGIAVTVLMNYLVADKTIAEWLMFAITLIAGIAPAVILITQTERHLNKTFNNNNEIR